MSKKNPTKRSKLLLAFERPTPPPPMTPLDKYHALAAATPHSLMFVNEMIEYLYDVEMRRRGGAR